jgi:tetratricopeptide (TPR) repeat protein
MNELLKIRLDLDEAITYDCFQEARKLAQEGLRKAREKELVGEIEYFQGQLAILEDNFQGAIAHFQRAIVHNPKDGASYNDWALCMVELGKIDEALRIFDKGIEAEPDFATIYHNKGWLLNKLGRYSEAIGCFDRALELSPNRAVTYENLADCLFNLQDYKGALVSYRKAFSLVEPRHSHIRQALLEKVKELEDFKKVDS